MSTFSQTIITLPPHSPLRLHCPNPARASPRPDPPLQARPLQFPPPHAYPLLLLPFTLSVFSHIPTPQPHLSNQFLRQLSHSAKPHNALLIYEKIMEDLGLDRFNFPPLLKAASLVSGLAEGMEIHGVAVKLGSIRTHLCRRLWLGFT